MRELPGKMTIPRVLHYCSLGIGLSVVVAFGNVRTVGMKGESPGIEHEGTTEVLYYLNVGTPKIQQAVDFGNAKSPEYKFVKIEVVQVTNPEKVPLKFELRFQPTGGDELFLGAFSLYPSDNPGDFIVATQGKLKAEGSLILTLVTPDTANGHLIKAAVRKLTFREN